MSIIKKLIELLARLIVAGVCVEFIFVNYGLKFMIILTPILMYWVVICLEDIILLVNDRWFVNLAKETEGEDENK